MAFLLHIYHNFSSCKGRCIEEKAAPWLKEDYIYDEADDESEKGSCRSSRKRTEQRRDIDSAGKLTT